MGTYVKGQGTVLFVKYFLAILTDFMTKYCVQILYVQIAYFFRRKYFLNHNIGPSEGGPKSSKAKSPSDAKWAFHPFCVRCDDKRRDWRPML
jgi:hypothetical protein